MSDKLYFHITSKQDNKYYQWILKYIIEIIGLEPVQQNQVSKETHLVYGEYDSFPNPNYISILHDTSSLVDGGILQGNANEEMLKTFDIITAIGKCLTDSINDNKESHCYDAHGRLNSLDSYQREFGFQDKPIVNIYINFLKRIIEQKFKFNYTPLLPDGIKFVVILSHDVDDPIKYAMLKAYKLFPKHLSPKNIILYHLEAIKKSVEKIIKKDENIYWVFEDVMNSESKYGFRSTFFFAARNKFHEYANQKRDVPYDIEDEEFSSIFKIMNERNFEIGLHTSYYAKNDENLLKEEKEKLERLSNKKLVGNRHHFWQIGKNPEQTVKSHLNAGLVYDSSLAFNDAPGYRRSVALPYFLFDQESNQIIYNMQIPTFMMDSNFLLNPEFGQDEALDQAKHYINQLKDIGGVGAIDWHVRTSYPSSQRFKKWGETYLQILEYLSQQDDIWVTNFESFYKWMEKRKKTLYNK